MQYMKPLGGVTEPQKKLKNDSEAELLQRMANFNFNSEMNVRTLNQFSNAPDAKLRAYQMKLRGQAYNPFGYNNYKDVPFKAKEVPQSMYRRPQIKDNILQDQLRRRKANSRASSHGD